MDRLRSKINQLLVEQSGSQRSAFTRSFATKPASDLEQQLGRVFGLVDIGSAEPIAEDFFHLVVEEIRQNYYYADRVPGFENESDTDIEAHWERALQKTNVAIAAFLESEQVAIDLSKMSVCLGVTHAGQLHLSFFGRIYAVLLHPGQTGSYRIVTIVDGATASLQRPNPLKLFSQVISGKLRERDILVLATNSVLDYFSLDRIKNLLTQRPVLEGLGELKCLMPKANLMTNFGVVALEVQKSVPAEPPKPPLAVEPAPNAARPRGLTDSIQGFIRTQQETEKMLSPRLLPEIKNHVAAVQNWLASLSRRFRKPSRPQKVHWPSARPGAAPTSPATSITTPQTPPRPTSAALGFGKAIVRVGVNLIAGAIVNPYRRAAAGVSRYLRRFPPKQRRAVVGIAIGVVLLVVSSTWLGLRNARIAREAAFAEGISAIEAMKNEAAASLIYRDEGQAREQLRQAKTRLSEITGSSDAQRGAITQLEQDIETELEKLRHRTVIEEPVLLANARNLNADATASPFLVLNGGELVGQHSTGAFFRVNIATQVLSALPQPATQPFTSAVTTRPNEIIVFDAEHKASVLNVANGSLRPAAHNLPSGATVTDLVTYLDRLYVLDGQAGQVYRSPASAAGLQQFGPWIRADQGRLAQGRSISVDGSLYALDGGQISRFENGQRVSFSQQFIDPALENPTKLRTTQQSTFLYVLDPSNQRLVVLSKDGKLVAQYTSSQFTELADFVIDERGQRAYLLAGTKIFAVPLQHLQ